MVIGNAEYIVRIHMRKSRPSYSDKIKQLLAREIKNHKDLAEQ